MVTDQQVKRLLRLVQTEARLGLAASKAGMNEKTARKYRRARKLPSEMKGKHTWRTRRDPFDEVWEEVRGMLKANPGFEAKTLFEYLQGKYPGRLADGQLRTFQRRVKVWRGLEGPGREVYFPQKHQPGVLCQSDFTSMNELGISLAGKRFAHLLYHFVLTYSNWETGTICFTESFESLSEGLQNALWELGGVPRVHQTDRLSSAVNNLNEREEFTKRYQGLLEHYGLQARKSQAGQPHENGDIEQSHHRFKRAVEQALLLRGSRDFTDRQEYEQFLGQLFRQLNAGRRGRSAEEISMLRELPAARLDAFKSLQVRVGPSSTIRVAHNTYSVHSRLVGERVEVRLYADRLEVWYAQRCVEDIPRLRGEGKQRINYRHIIDRLVRKPGAFENYRYREDLFPSSHFRMAYDLLKERLPRRAGQEYVGILELAAKESESRVEDALRFLLRRGEAITRGRVEDILASGQDIPSPTEVFIDHVDLAVYDQLLSEKEENDATGPGGCENLPDGISERFAAGHGGGVLRGGGPDSPAGDTELRTLPAGRDGTGVGRSAPETDRAVLAGVEIAVGEEPGEFPTGEAASQGHPANKHPSGGVFPGS